MIFKIEPISQERFNSMKKTGAWSSDSPVGPERLRSVFVSYIDFEGHLKHDGEIIVLDSVSQATVNIFKDLLEIKFPIHSVRPIDEYNANDDLSVLANNTSAFCFRSIENTTTLSVHSYGVAIDLNPYMNPYIAPIRNPGGMVEIADYKMDYLQRTPPKRGMVEPVVPVFKKYGFRVWGGHWTWPLDYHHFQTSRTQGELMVQLGSKEAEIFFMFCLENPKFVELIEKQVDEKRAPLLDYIIKESRSGQRSFYDVLESLFKKRDKV